MSLLAPAALALSLLALPIVLLYMLRLRRREQPVSSTWLWRELVRDRAANAPWQRLRRNLLLLLQLLILAALVLALVNAPLQLVELGPVHDPRAPQIPGMFGDRRTPAFTNAYQRYRWDANRNCLSDYSSRWEATVLGMGVTRGETIYTCLLYTSDAADE